MSIDATTPEPFRLFMQSVAKPSGEACHFRQGTAGVRAQVANQAWEGVGLEREKEVYAIRHTLGTLASRNFTPGMVQAAMGHKSRKSSEAYFHPDEAMASEVRQKIASELFQNHAKTRQNANTPAMIIHDNQGVAERPCCGCKVLIIKEKGHNSK